MKESAVKSFDEDDLRLIEIMEELGVSRTVARLVIYLANVNEASSKEIEIATGLRQPEVSIGMRTLRTNQWVKEQEIKTLGKGRPMKLYSLNASLDTISKKLEDDKIAETSHALETIKRLKEMALS
jgi:predicted transcriptional regulator